MLGVFLGSVVLDETRMKWVKFVDGILLGGCWGLPFILI